MKPRFFACVVRFLMMGVAAAVFATPAVALPQGAEQLREPPKAEQAQAAGEQRQQAADDQQPPTPRREESIVVTADRATESLRDVGSTVAVISGEEIRASGARWLTDVLQFVSGVSVVRSGPPGTLVESYIRGANASHTLVMIDGVKLNSPTSGYYDVSGLQLGADQIERIEVVKGPQSTLYGSQAVGGVINVITRRGAGPGAFGIEAEGGSYATGGLHGWANGQLDALRYAGGVSFRDSGGFSSADADNGNGEPDGNRNVTWHGRVDWAGESGVLARGFVHGFDSALDYDGYDFVSGPTDVLTNVQTAHETYAGGAFGYAGERLSSIVEVTATEAHLETVTPDDFFLGFGLDSSIREVDWQNDLALGADNALTAGIEYRREQAALESISLLGADGFTEAVDFVGLYLHDRARIGDRASLTGGLRYESHSTFGGKWTGRATASVELAPAARLHGSVGTAFKAPTLNDLYYPGFSNPALRPEESTGLDLGIEAVLPGAPVVLDATFFYNDIDELITFDFLSGAPANLAHVVTRGLETSADWSPRRWLKLAGNYTFTDARDAGSGAQLVRRPRHQAGIRATVTPAARWRAWGELRAKGARRDNGVTGPVSLERFAEVNLAAEYALSDVVALRGRVDNLFDAAYQEVFGYGTPGLSGYLGLAVSMGRR